MQRRAAAALVAFLTLSPAAAAQNRVLLRTWGSPGTGPGQFDTIIGLATDPQGHVYVSDLTRVQKFTPTGTFLFSIAATGKLATGPGGELYVAGRDRVRKFDANGTLILEWTAASFATGLKDIAADPFGSVYVLDCAAVSRFASNGAFVLSWSPGVGCGGMRYPTSLAADRFGYVYLQNNDELGSAGIRRFDAQGRQEQLFAYTDESIDIASDLDGHVYAQEIFIFAGNPSQRIVEFDATGRRVDRWFGAGAPWIAASPDGTLYTAGGTRVNKFSDAPRMNLDLPASNTVTQPFTVAGWAFHRGDPTAGANVDTVHVWAYPASGAPIFVGADYGRARPDVAAAFGRGDLTSTGFAVTAGALAPGTYTIVAYAHSTLAGTFNVAVARTIAVAASVPLMVIDTPRAGATVQGTWTIAGWAIDPAAPSSTGVDVVHVWAVPAGGGTPRFLGAGTFVARPDVAAYFGDPRFTMSGYGLTVASGALPAGAHDVIVFARSTVTGTFNNAQVVRVIVP